MVVREIKLPSIGRTDIGKSHSHESNMRKLILQDRILPIIFLKYFFLGLEGRLIIEIFAIIPSLFEYIYGRGLFRAKIKYNMYENIIIIS